MKQEFGDLSSYKDLKEFYEKNLDESLKDEKSIFYFCSYVPVEVIYASGFRPVRLNVNLETFYLTDEVTPKYLCPYLKSIIELFLKKSLKRKNIIFTDGCDSSRRVFEIFKELGFVDKFYYLKIPFNENPKDMEFFKDEIEKLYLLLNGKIDKEKLVNSINLYNSGKKKLKELVISSQIDSLTKNYLNYIFQIVDIEDFLKQDFKFNNKDSEMKNRFYLFSTIFPLKFIEFANSLGISFDYDDTCFGYKNLSLIEEDSLFSEDPLFCIAKYYLKREGCVRKRDFNSRIESIIKNYKNGNYKGVIIYNLKYCDPLTFYLPLIKDRLSKENIPTLIIDDDYTLGAKGQIRTRIEAFLEMVKWRRWLNEGDG